MRINSINSNMQYKMQQSRKQSSPAFKGAETKTLTGLAGFLDRHIAHSKTFETIATNLSKSDKSFTVLMVLESAILSGFYMINTAKNKKIKKEQKPQMLINDALTWGVSTAGTILLDGKIKKFVDEGAEKYIANRKDFYRGLGESGGQSKFKELINKVGDVVATTGDKLKGGADDVVQIMGEHLKTLVGKGDKLKTFQIKKEDLEAVQASVKEAITTAPETAKTVVADKVKNLYSELGGRLEADKFTTGMGKIRTVIICGIIYRYLGPVLVTPLANKLSSKFFGNKKAEQKNPAKTEQKK